MATSALHRATRSAASSTWVVCPPTVNFPDFALTANKFCRTLDGDPYVDAIWGILTGFDTDHSLELARSEPVAIRLAAWRLRWQNPWVRIEREYGR